jgi:flagellum-specific peptidoglycan hydrolase FlgJ
MGERILKKVKRKRINSKSGCLISLTLLLIVLVVYYVGVLIINDNKKKQVINVSNETISMYIDETDNISLKRVQLNWKEIAAIDGAMRKNDFTEITGENIQSIGKKFFIEKEVEGKKVVGIKSVEEVENELNLSKSQKKMVDSNLKQLKEIGLVSSNLKSNSPNKIFIEDLKIEAIEIYKKYGILPSVIIAQAALETGWGKSELALKSNNLFGIKADKSWNGKKINMKTSENFNDTIYDNFRVYDSKSESIKDYGEFLKNNKRYRENGVFNADIYFNQAKAIEKAGYSTKANDSGQLLYSKLLISIIKENDLQLIDYEVKKEENNKLINR